jgi:hypothetical protein
VETAGVEPAPPRCKRGALPPELHPQVMRTDGVEPPQREAPRLQRGELTSAQRPLGGVADRIRTDAARFTTSGACRYTTATMSGDDRTRTGGLSPDKRALCSSELHPPRHRLRCRPSGCASSARASVEPFDPIRIDTNAPISSAGGIRTHGLELMRLARTASPLPRRSGRQESNLRSPVPETGGVANSPTARRSTPGGARTRSFRVEGPASSPVRPRGRELRRQGSNLRLAVNSRASCRSTTPEQAEGEGVEPPRPGGPPVFETGYRTWWQSFLVTPAGFEPARRRLRVGSSAS